MSTHTNKKSPNAEADARREILRRASAIGLCASCVHLVAARSRRSVFVRCALAGTDSRFARYPTLPVRECVGFAPCVP